MHSFASLSLLLLVFPALLLCYAETQPHSLRDGHSPITGRYNHDTLTSHRHTRRKFGREPVARNLNETSYNKRDGSSRFSHYVAGLGACGGTNSGSDFIVALSAVDWAGGSHCYNTITITYNGKSTSAQIVDECEDCPHNGLDLSDGLFAFLADPSLGIIYGDWSYGSGAAPPPKSSSTPPAPSSSSSSYSPPPSSSVAKSTSQPIPSTTSSHVSESSSSTAPSSSTSALPSESASSVSAAATPTAAATQAPTATLSPDDPQFLNQVNIAILNLGGLITVGFASEN